MAERSPDLYKELQSHALTIFKGDLNGRKLISDLTWPETTHFEKSLRNFNINLVLFRTLKAETLSGLHILLICLLRQCKRFLFSNPNFATFL
jgi:hypothetical protein